MSIGAINADIAAVSGPPLVGRVSQATAQPSFEFGRLLSWMNSTAGLDATDPAVPQPMIDGDSVAKTEVARSISVVGHLRMTRVQFADGSSDVAVSATGEDITQIPAPVLPAAIDLPPSRIRSFSDLEPEVGIGGRQDGSGRWAGRNAVRVAGNHARSRSTETAKVAPLVELQARVAALDELGVGRLFDILT